MALLKVNKSAQVLFLKPSEDYPDYPWIVLCYDPAMQNDKWIVWFADNDGKTITGGYHSTLEEAKAEFDSRPEGTPEISN
jgi:uncharacterized membrane protein